MKILLGAIYPYAFLLLYLIIPFDNYIRVLPNILLAILVFGFPLVVTKEDFHKLKSSPVLVFFAFFIFLIVNAAINDRLETDFNIIKKVLIVVGLLILYIPVVDTKKIKTAIIFSSLAAILFSVINLVLTNNINGEFLYENYPKLIESLLIDRIYLGFLSVLSIISSYDSMRKEFRPENKYYLANIIINILFIGLIVSMMGLLILFFVLVLRQFYGRNKKIRILITLITLAIFSVVFISVKEDLRKQVFLTNNSQYSSNIAKNTLTWDIRTITWHCAKIISSDLGLNINGLGFAGTKNQLSSCYESEIEDEVKREQFVSQRYNTHNQFIDFYLSGGIIGLLLFMAFLGLLFFNVKKNFFASALLLVLALYCFIENIFHRQVGAYYVGFILIVLLTNTWKNREIAE